MRILVVQHEDGTGPGIVGEALEAAGLRLDLRHPWAGKALPDSLADHDALLVLGGAPNCEDDAAAPWLPQVRALIREAVEREVPFLGICLGAQIAASCLGGTVVRRARPPEIGAVPLRRLPAVTDDPVLGAVPDGAPAAQWHWDEIAGLPPGAVPLLTGDDCDHQAFRVGPAAWGVQFHPEVLGAEVARWAASDGPATRAAGADPDAAVASVRAAEPRLRETWTAMSRAWGAVVTARATTPH
ncbi:type 1 glutamine amidotransferase [Streptacidiphilus jiangxiensis]|uniref:GMP synthase-Glutamine amidotransferase n=1 Tax=Streptacidiphilus jiangxiensis TaxID=235985 RepID=A0A1H7V2C2_STRJI|nr:type 1 glutamine amidotransferase [Streptacidiphilus jiangxiensis]SEM03294.1 GMP synthase-Glutamine amidotransferase [Streptacidiphilus jiangxiensis]